jgi:hypothetical protein
MSGLLPILVVLLVSISAVPGCAGGGRSGADERSTGVPEAHLDSPQSPELPESPYFELQPIEIQAERLYAVAVDSRDRILASADRRILVFDRAGESLGGFVLEEPARCLSAGPEDLLYLGLIDHVEVYEHTGRRRAVWAGLGNEARITSIYATREGVFVADAGNHMVLRFDRGGRLLDYIRGDGSGGPELIIPSPYFDLLVTAQGTLWATNPGRHRLHG